MSVGFWCRDSTAWSAGEESELDEEGFVDVLNGFALFARCGSNGLDADGTAGKFVNQCRENVSVGRLESKMVYLEKTERLNGDVSSDDFDISSLRIVADAFEETIGNSRGVSACLGNPLCAGGVDANIKDATRSREDASYLFLGIKFEAMYGAEAIAKRIGNGAEPSGCADQGKLGQVELDGARRGTLPDDDIELVVFHCRVENFFDEFVETVNFVDEEHVAVFEVCED